MKKITSVLLVFVLAAALMATSALAAGSVSVSDATASAGGTATVTVSASGVGSFTSLLGALTYDTDKLTLTAVKPVGGIAGAMDVSNVTGESEVAGVTNMFAWNAANGKVAYAAGSDKTGSGQLFELTFKVAGSVADKAELPVSVEVAFNDDTAGLKDEGTITVDGGAVKPTYSYTVDLSGAQVSGSSVSGVGKLVSVGGQADEGKKYAYIAVNYVRDDGTTWAVVGTYPVDEDGSFDIPTITGVKDAIGSVVVVALDSKVGANWSGHNIAAPARIAPAA